MARRLTTDIVSTYANLLGVPPPLALAIWQQESGSGTNTKTSSKGAVGDFQVMPATFKRVLPDGNINDPVDNMRAGLMVLRDNLKRYGGDWEKAAQAYYHGKALTGPGAGPTSGAGTPSVLQYGKQVLAKANALAGPSSTSVARTEPVPAVGEAPTQGGQALENLSPYMNTAGSDTMFGNDLAGSAPQQPDLGGSQFMPDLGRLASAAPTGSFGAQGDLAANARGSQDYEVDRFIRQIVDEELKPNA